MSLLLIQATDLRVSAAEPSKTSVTYSAKVLRDRYGVPHVFGNTTADVAYALGQCQCEDRGEAVWENLLAGMGELASLKGESALEADKRARLLQNRAAAEKDWPHLPEELKAYLQAFARGVNDWGTAHPERLSLRPREVTPLDVMAWNRHVLLNGALRIAEFDASNPLAPHPGTEPGKSNSWAVDGEKSASGKPILLIDPHWPFEGPLQLYEAHLVAPGLDIWGMMLTGTAVVGLGANRNIGWTYTAGGADSSDAYELRLNPANSLEYEWDGTFIPMYSHEETISVRKADTLEQHVVRISSTHHGPVLALSSGKTWAARLPGWNGAGITRQLWMMGQAKSAQEFEAAISQDELYYFNLMWAARSGEIGYVQTGNVPQRSRDQDWVHLVPGWTSKTFLPGNIPFDQLPRVKNPATHFLQNCNTSANVVTPGLKMSPTDFPPGTLFGHYGEYRARGQRATQLLMDARKLDLNSAMQITFDTYCLPADLWIPVLVSAEKLAGNDAELSEALRMLKEWDRRVDAQSAGATLFRFWRLHCDLMPNSRAGRDAFVVSNSADIQADALAALRNAIADLKTRYGRLAVPWGEIKRLRRGSTEWALSGDGLGKLGLDTLRATAADTFDGQNKMIIGGGQSSVALVFFADEHPRIHAVVGYGQSNLPTSPHFADQAPLYANHQLRPVPWTEADIRAHLSSEVTITGPNLSAQK